MSRFGDMFRRTPREQARQALVRAVRSAADRLNFDMLWRDYYSPLPRREDLTDAFFERRSDLAGIKWREREQVEYFDRLVPHMPRQGDLPAWIEGNVSYAELDAAVLYATVRMLKPPRIIELGSGYSTIITATAAAANARDGHHCSFVAADPYPSPVLSPPPAGLSELRSVGAVEFPVEELHALSAGDILFIDTTHVVKAGSEVNHLFLEVLPQIRPGVLVHVHDIFLPWSYPREWLLERGYFWNEQYLLHAYLINNENVEIALATHWLQREMCNCRTGVSETPTAGSFWFRII
jgi:Methyltransferase domain